MAATFPKTEWIWKDGKFIRWESATLHVMSHVVHYGSSVFEGIRCYHTPEGPSIFRLDDHLRRMEDSAKVYRMETPFSREEMAEACRVLVAKNDLDSCYIRPISLRGLGAAGVNPLASPVETYLICWPWGAYLGADALAEGVDVCVSSWHRPAPDTVPALAKAGGNYLNSQLIKMEALANGYTEGIALAPSGLVSEGSGQNLFLVRDGTLITPSQEGTILQGITRDCVLTLAQEMGIPVRQQAVPRELLYMADEVFFTGTAAEITPVRSIDRITIGTGRAGEISLRLQERLLGIAQGQYPDRYGWRTLVPQAEAAVA
jgi:branched-chain amino acid aminotransferase